MIDKPSLLLAVFCLTGCTTGDMTLRLSPPTVQPESLMLRDDAARLSVRIDNLNDHAIELEQLQLTLRFDPDTEFTTTDWPLALDIGPRGRDVVTRPVTIPPSARARLEALRDQNSSSSLELRYSAKVRGQRAAKGGQRVFLHPVPGQPDQFRFAAGARDRTRDGGDW